MQLTGLPAVLPRSEDMIRSVDFEATPPAYWRVVTFAAAVLLFLLLFMMANVVPKFEGVFAQLPGGVEGLPGITKVVMAISEWLVAWWWAFVLGVLAVVWVIAWVLRRGGAGRA
jgi:type II secretory pathway component PulF